MNAVLCFCVCQCPHQGLLWHRVRCVPFVILQELGRFREAKAEKERTEAVVFTYWLMNLLFKVPPPPLDPNAVTAVLLLLLFSSSCAEDFVLF